MLVGFNAALHSQWSKIGFDGKTVNSVSSNQINGTIYAVADKKLFKTSNNGLNWDSLHNGLNLLDIYKVQVDIDGKVYVGSNSGIYSSVDEGNSFQSLNANLPNDFGLRPSVTSICCLNNSLFIGTSNGVYTSKKNSISWEFFNNNLPSAQANRNMVFFNNCLYVAMNMGIYKTQIDTNNWVKCYSGDTNDIEIVGNDLYAGVSVSCPAVMKSSDFGETWVFGSPKSGNCNGLSIFSFDNSIWVGTFYGGGIRSTDNGKSWGSFDLGGWYSVLNMSRRGSSLLAASAYYSFHTGSGGLYIKNNIFANIKEVLPFPEFGKAPGLYDGTIEVSLTVPNNSTVYYTEDGSIPSILAKVYSSPIVVGNSKIIKAITINTNGEQSKVNTGLFNIKSDNLNTKALELKDNSSTIFPNPCTTYLNIKINDTYSKIEIINIQGKIVYSFTTSNPTKDLSINIENLEPGVFFLKLQGLKTSETFKFIKK